MPHSQNQVHYSAIIYFILYLYTPLKHLPWNRIHRTFIIEADQYLSASYFKPSLWGTHNEMDEVEAEREVLLGIFLIEHNIFCKKSSVNWRLFLNSMHSCSNSSNNGRRKKNQKANLSQSMADHGVQSHYCIV